MRVCEAHRIKAAVTLKSIQDDAEFDLCPECYEAFQLLVSGAFFADGEPEFRKRGRPPKATASA